MHKVGLHEQNISELAFMSGKVCVFLEPAKICPVTQGATGNS